MPSLPPYKGYSRKLVLAFDIGTTFSGVSYAILDRDEVPKERTVSRFPGQGAGDAKIPSVICYTQDGKVEAVGAEAADESMLVRVKEEGLVLVERFKMHLRPSALVHRGKTDMKLKPLPQGKTVVDVFTDFLSYLFECTKAYIEEAHPSGKSLWSSFEGVYEIILSHPNGWGGSQQAKMRDAVIRAGILPDTPAGSQRLHFVTEGEASMNYCVGQGLAETGVNAEDTVLVIDAGGGTIDISTYCFKKMSPLALEETAPAECLLQGATTVNDRAEQFLQSKLANSKYNSEEDLSAMLKAFEWSTKRSFKNVAASSKVRFGTTRDHDKEFGISFGQMTIPGGDIAKMFAPSINAIAAAVESQCKASSEKISLAFLVGGFAASPFLFTQVKAKLGEKGISLSRPEESPGKAVSHGAVWHYLGGYIAARVAGWTFGTTSVIDFDADDSEHLARKNHLVLSPSGMIGVSGHFAPLLVKGTRMQENQEVSKTFCREAPNPLAFRREIEVEILCYHGEEACPKWIDKEPDTFKTKCTVRADTSGIDTMPMFGRRGLFCVQTFEVVLACGQTEIKAFIRWDEDGVEKRGDAQIVYEDDTHEED